MVNRHILHNHAKFRKYRPIRCCDIAFFVIFQDGCRHLVFKKIENFNDMSPVGGQSAPVYQISPKSVKRLHGYGSLTVFFFKMAASAILAMSGVHWDHLRRPLGNLYRCAKFGLNRCSIFDHTLAR